MLPHARDDGLVLQELPDELVVYDLKSDKAHCLNRTAALVWRHCDGQTSVAAMAQLLHQELQVPADTDLVRLALDRLERAKLLRAPLALPEAEGPPAARVTRRELARKLALTGGLTLLIPTVLSIVAPTPAQAAASCVSICTNVPSGTPCRSLITGACTSTCQGGNCV